MNSFCRQVLIAHISTLIIVELTAWYLHPVLIRKLLTSVTGMTTMTLEQSLKPSPDSVYIALQYQTIQN